MELGEAKEGTLDAALKCIIFPRNGMFLASRDLVECTWHASYIQGIIP